MMYSVESTPRTITQSHVNEGLIEDFTKVEKMSKHISISDIISQHFS